MGWHRAIVTAFQWLPESSQVMQPTLPSAWTLSTHSMGQQKQGRIFGFGHPSGKLTCPVGSGQPFKCCLPFPAWSNLQLLLLCGST